MPGFWRSISIGADLRPPKWEASAHEQAEIWWLINPKPWNELWQGTPSVSNCSVHAATLQMLKVCRLDHLL